LTHVLNTLNRTPWYFICSVENSYLPNKCRR